MAFLITLYALWTYPIATLLFYLFTKRRPALRRIVLIGNLIIVLITFFGILTNISTTLSELDWLLVTSIYLLFCLCIWQMWFQSKGFIKLISLLAMIGVLGFCYLMGTIGILGVGFVTAEYEADTQHWLDSELIYKEYTLGNAISDHRGKKVEVYKTISWLPLVEWRIQHKTYNEITTYLEPLKVTFNKTERTLLLSVDAPFGRDHQILHWKDSIQIER